MAVCLFLGRADAAGRGQAFCRQCFQKSRAISVPYGRGCGVGGGSGAGGGGDASGAGGNGVGVGGAAPAGGCAGPGGVAGSGGAGGLGLTSEPMVEPRVSSMARVSSL
jgi:hypothetical protein